MVDDNKFKALVNKYVELSDQIAEVGVELVALRKKKDAMGELVMQVMQQGDIQVLELTEQGGKLIRRESKRTEALKKEHILDELMLLTGNDATRAQASLEKIYNKRTLVVKDALSRKR